MVCHVLAATARVQADDRDDVGPGGPLAGRARPGGAHLARHLGQDRPGGPRVPVEQRVEGRTRHLDETRVPAGADTRRPRLAGEQRELAHDRPRGQRPQQPVALDHLQATAAQQVRRPGRVAFTDQPLPRVQVEPAAGLGQGDAGILGERGHERDVVQADRRSGPERFGREVLGLGQQQQRRAVLDVLVVRAGRHLADRQGDERDEDERDDRQHPAVPEGGHDARAGGVAHDQDEDRDAQHAAELAGAGDEGRRRRVPTPGHRGEGCAAEQRQGGAHPDARQDLARQPLGPEGRLEADHLVVPEVGAGPHQRAGDDQDPVPHPLGERSEPGGHHRSHQRARHQRQARTQDVVPPHVLEPQDVGQQVGVEAEARQDGRGTRRPEGPDAHERRVDDRRTVAQRAPHEQRGEEGGEQERAQDPRAAPAPVVALDDAQVQQRQGARQQQRTRDVRHDAAARRPALHDRTTRGHDGEHAERQVDQERPAPPAELDQGTAHRRPQAGGHGGRRSPQPDGVRPPVTRERLDHDGQRGRHEHRRSQRLEDAAGHEELQGGGRRTPQRRQREEGDAADVRTPPPDQVREPPAHHQERREHDVVGVEHPRQRGDRRLGERLPDRRERDVHDGRVEERQERAEARDQQDSGRCDPTGDVLGHRFSSLRDVRRVDTLSRADPRRKRALACLHGQSRPHRPRGRPGRTRVRALGADQGARGQLGAQPALAPGGQVRRHRARLRPRRRGSMRWSPTCSRSASTASTSSSSARTNRPSASPSGSASSSSAPTTRASSPRSPRPSPPTG